MSENHTIKSVAVYCGHRLGDNDAFPTAGALLGASIAQREYRLVYGGGRLGMMGAVADAALAEGGEVVGVIPEALVEKEQAHTGLSEQHVVASMHERKTLIVNLSDAFCVLPGGVGTLDELFEAVTWYQLSIHRKPIVLINTEGYYDGLWAFLTRSAGMGFIPQETFDMLTLTATPEEALQSFEAYTPR